MSWQRGFTLMEMMIVLVISTLISAVALPQYNRITRTRIAKENALHHTATSIQLGIESYYLEHGQYPSDAAIEALLATLKTHGTLTQTPLNPYTKKAFSNADTRGKLHYTADADADTYTLIGYGADTKTALFSLGQ